MNKKINNKNPRVKTSSSTIAKTPFWENNRVIYLLLGLVVLFVIIARIHLLSFPLERDEGEYAYMGKLILDGHAPYSLAYNMKYPGTYYMYALIMAIFGKSIVGIHLGLLIVSVASTVLLFFISKNFISKIGAVIVAASFGIMGTSFGLLGQAAHATQFVSFFALLGIYFIFQAYKNDKHKILKYLLSGIFFSFAFICKQSGLFFVFFGYSVILIKEFSLKPLRIPWKNLLLFTAGFVAPVLLMFLAFYVAGIFDKFWFWTYTYLSQYGTQNSISQAFGSFMVGVNLVTLSYYSIGYTVLWAIALLGIPMIFAYCKTTKEKLMILSFLLFSFLTTVPGFYFRPHYFVTLLPAMALLIGLFFDFFNRLFLEKLKRPNLVFISLLMFLVVMGQGIMANKGYLFTTDSAISCKWGYGPHPFVESVQLGEYLKQHSKPEDKIAILGSEPQILFYADRYSATGYLYTFSLMEPQPYALTMQKEMINEIELNQPKYIVFVTMTSSWVRRVNSDRYIITWVNDYLNQHYKTIGFMDVTPDKIASLETEKQINTYQPAGEIIGLLERVDKQ